MSPYVAWGPVGARNLLCEFEIKGTGWISSPQGESSGGRDHSLSHTNFMFLMYCFVCNVPLSGGVDERRFCLVNLEVANERSHSMKRYETGKIRCLF
jgi:hypothetical protein